MTIHRSAIAKIHIARQQLGMDEETYRAMLQQHGGVRSAKDLNERTLARVLAHLKSCGAKFAPPRRAGKRPHNYDRLPGYVAKVEAMLADMGLSWAYADSIARNITGGKGAPDINKAPGVERLAWVKRSEHWRAIIAALEAEQTKRARLARVDELLGLLGFDRGYVETLLDGCPRAGKWLRDARLLGAIIEHLTEKVGAA
ncbi:MAG: regulatory protein GemA [Porticoccaceae bacterium]|jgi:hypothetical protein|nr:regulatory protein GemA [Porticoccaceae bacterium]